MMLVNASDPEESRIAIVDDGFLSDLYVERSSHESLIGNLYKARVTNVVPSLQAAFVDLGLEKNAFLHASEFAPSFAARASGESGDRDGKDDKDGRDDKEPADHRRKVPTISDMLRRDQELLVQVIRDGIGEKGPSVTADLSVAGRYLVLTPKSRSIGVSRKISDPAQRDKLRKLLEELNPPAGLGFIIRTAGVEQNKRDLQRDLSNLVRLWNMIVDRAKKATAPALVYQETDMVTRIVRDIFEASIDKIIIDSQSVHVRVVNFFRSFMPRYLNRIQPIYHGEEPLFYKFGVESQIEQSQQRTVALKSGGSIVIEHTEALTAIDVNSGKFSGGVSPEEMAFQTNMEAAAEIMMQLRLRDIGGVIIVDLIDMRDPRHRRAVEKALRDASRSDRSEMSILRMSQFCIIEMAREKVRPGMKLLAYEACNMCGGTGMVKTLESVALDTLRRIRQFMSKAEGAQVTCSLNPTVGAFVQNMKRKDLCELEERYHKTIVVKPERDFAVERVEIV